MTDIFSFDPDFVDESCKSNIEDYICCICQFIPNCETAIEEENCGHLFCQICLNNWIKKMNKCPFCKEIISQRKIKDKNKLVYRFLINLLVLCKDENCKWKGTLKEYYEHLKKHDNKIQKQYNNNINNNNYNNYINHNNNDNNDNIIDNNINNNNINNNNNNNINNNFNFELYKYYKATVHEHPLKFLDLTLANNWCCDGRSLPSKCLSGITDFNQSKGLKRFRCVSCDFDLCLRCMENYYDRNFEIKNDLSNNRNFYILNKKYFTLVHKHPLKFIDKKKDNNWACDGRNLNEKCFSGITSFGQSKNIPRFRCENCDFDLCENCMNHYKEKFYYQINQFYKISVHKHPLKYLEKTRDNDWACDGRKLNDGCLSGTTDFKQTKGFERFRCEKCDFDLCKNCMDYYKNKNDNCIIF